MCPTDPHELPRGEDRVLDALWVVIHLAVRLLAVLMTAVIAWGVADVVIVLYRRLLEPPFLLLTVSDLLATFSAFMVMLIAIEIFVNITVYLPHDVIQVQIVLAAALMAVSRNVLVLDLDKTSPQEVPRRTGERRAVALEGGPSRGHRGVLHRRHPRPTRNPAHTGWFPARPTSAP